MFRLLLQATAVLAIAGFLQGAAQERLLPPVLRAELPANASTVYFLLPDPGDVLSTTLTLVRGGAVRVEFRMEAGPALEGLSLSQPGEVSISMNVPTTGRVLVNVTAESGLPSTIALATKSEPPGLRMAGVHVSPTIRYESPRILKLRDDIRRAGIEAVAAFWQEIAANGSPIVEPDTSVVAGGGRSGSPASAGDEVLVTFLWRETYPTYNVAVVRPPFSQSDYFMTKLVGTDVWFKTMRIHRSSRFTYRLAPNVRPGEVGVTWQPDPLNRRCVPEDIPNCAHAFRSVLELDGAPDESWATRQPLQPGTIVRHTFSSSSLNAGMDLVVYTPAGFSSTMGPYPVVVLLDGDGYEDPIAAPTTASNLIEAGRMRPAVLCLVSSTTTAGNRAVNLNFNPNFNKALATEIVPWLRRSFATSSSPKDVIIGGYSAGGRAAADIALEYPETFGNVLSQSGAFRGGQIQQAVIRRERFSIRFFLEVGLYDNVPAAELPLDEGALDPGVTLANRHLRDVLLAKGYEVIYRETGGDHDWLHWRSMLAEGLIALLGTPRRE